MENSVSSGYHASCTLDRPAGSPRVGVQEPWLLPDSDFVRSGSGERFSADGRKQKLDGRKRQQNALLRDPGQLNCHRPGEDFETMHIVRELGEIQMHVPPKCS